LKFGVWRLGFGVVWCEIPSIIGTNLFAIIQIDWRLAFQQRQTPNTKHQTL